jgi:hypothetical protein
VRGWGGNVVPSGSRGCGMHASKDSSALVVS